MDEWHYLGALSDIPEDKLWPVSVAGKSWVLVRQGTQLSCFYDLCSHQDVKLSEFAQLDAQGGILCFAHGARFSPLNGDPLCFPGKLPLWKADLRLESGAVWIRLPHNLPE